MCRLSTGFVLSKNFEVRNSIEHLFIIIIANRLVTYYYGVTNKRQNKNSNNKK